MTKLEHLLTILGEECHELNMAIAVTMSLNDELFNENFILEFLHIESIIEMLSDETSIINLDNVKIMKELKTTDKMFLVSTLIGVTSKLGIIASKSLRFGLEDSHPNEPTKTNALNIIELFNEIKYIVSLLQKLNYIPQIGELKRNKIKETKKEKVLYYLEYSKEKGLCKN